MTTILKEMGIQQWRLRSVELDSATDGELMSVTEQSLSYQSTSHENSPDHAALGHGELQHKHTRGLSDTEQPMSTAEPVSLLESATQAEPVTPAITAVPQVAAVLTPMPSPAPTAVATAPVPIAMPAKAPELQHINDGATSSDPVALLDWQGLQALIDEQHYCHTCGSANSSLGAGDANADWLFISDAPTRSDLTQHQLFSGRAGQLYEAMLSAVGLDRAAVYTTSVFKCVASDDLSAVPNCDKLLQRQIGLLRPRVIVAFGEFAAQSVAKSNENLEKLRGQNLTCHISKVPIVASYSPLQLLDEPSLKSGAWQDLKKCLAITR